MQFAEVIYETGSKSVVSFEDEKELLAGLRNHHERATKGEPGRGKSTPRNDLEPGAPQVMDYPAERIKRVLIYDKHPADLNEDMTLSSDVAKKEIETMLKEGPVINVMELAARIRDLTNPVLPDEEVGVHDSQFKMKEVKELELDFA